MQLNHEKKGLTSIIKYLLPILWLSGKDFKLRWLLAIVCVLFGVFFNILSPLLFRQLVDALIGSAQGKVQLHVFWFLFAYAASWCASKVIVHIGELFVFRAVSRGVRNFSFKMFDHLMNLSADFHINRATGGVAEAVFRAQEGMFDIFWGMFFSILPLMIEIVIATFIIAWFFGGLLALLFVSILCAYILFSHFGLEWISRAQRILNSIKIRTGAKVVDSLLNYETVKVFNNTEHESNMVNQLFIGQEDAYVNFAWRIDLVHVGQSLVIGVGLMLLTMVTGQKVLKGQFSIGDFTMLNWYLLQFVAPLSYLGKVLKDVRKGINNTSNAIELLALQAQVKDCPDAQELKAVNPRLEFRQVNFGYHDDRNILKDVSFVVEPGQTVALVGMTGSGKSTIARLLYRFYDINSGSILLDGIDLRELKQDSLQRSIGIVPQDTVLFNDTLFYNINYGDLHATADEVYAAVERAHLSLIAQALPEGLNTKVGERGLKLSGGEKQRVAIARVILKKPAIYIFDEATSALDTTTEKQIHQNLREISQGCTTVIIAHRLSTVVHADKIIVLEHGRIIETGNHQQLLQENGVYAKLYRQQT